MNEKKKNYTAYSLQDFADLKPRKTTFIIDGLLRVGSKRPSIIVGLPEAGKSCLAQQMAKCVARGEDFLDRPVQKGRVIYWQSEEEVHDAAEDFLRGTDVTDPVLVLHPIKNNIEELTACLNDYPDTVLVIVETLMQFFPTEDINKNSEITKYLTRFSNEVVSKFPNTAFVVLHWFNKSDNKRGLALTQMLGGTTIPGLTDTKIYLSQVSDADPRRIVHITVRRGKGIRPSYLAWDEDTHTVKLESLVSEEKSVTKEAVHDAAANQAKEKILAAVRRNQGASINAIINAVGSPNRNIFYKRYGELVDDGRLVVIEGSSKNAKAIYTADCPAIFKGAESDQPASPVDMTADATGTTKENMTEEAIDALLNVEPGHEDWAAIARMLDSQDLTTNPEETTDLMMDAFATDRNDTGGKRGIPRLGEWNDIANALAKGTA